MRPPSAPQTPATGTLAGPDIAAGQRHCVVFGLGSNLGDRLATLRRAATLLVARAGLQQPRHSRVYLTPPLGPPQPHYLNAAVAGETALALPELLALALEVERQLGRTRPDPIRWGPRTIDIDLLWSSRLVAAQDGLAVPHVGLPQRAFALRPLLDVVPDARDPTSGSRYADLPLAGTSITVHAEL